MLKRGLLVALSVIGGSAFAVGTVHADPPGVHYSGSESFSFDDCGFRIDAVTTFSGLFINKGIRHGVEDAPYLLYNYRFDNVYTNPATGASFTISGNGVQKDLHIERVSGNIISLDTLNVGQPIVVRDMNGKVVLRDRGHLRFRVQLDTQGDGNIDNDVEVPGTFEVIGVNGPHPVFDGVDLCQVARDLIG